MPFFTTNRIVCRGVARGGPGWPEPTQNLADQLTLFKPGGQIMPLTLLPAPPDSKSYLHLWFAVAAWLGNRIGVGDSTNPRV